VVVRQRNQQPFGMISILGRRETSWLKGDRRGRAGALLAREKGHDER
jgi:hypothetical protein